MRMLWLVVLWCPAAACARVLAQRIEHGATSATELARDTTGRRRLSEFPACGVRLYLQESGRGLENVYCATSPTLEYVLDKDEVPVYIGVGCCDNSGACHRHAGTYDNDGCFAGWYDEPSNVLGDPKTWHQAMDLCHNEGKELCAAPLSYGICHGVGCWYNLLYQWSTTQCEPGDANYQAACGSFVYVDQDLSWEDARAHCRANYHDLASIHSASENAKVDALCPDRCWIGGSDEAREGTWTWSDGTAWDYQNWYSDQPDNWWYTNGEDLLEIGWGQSDTWNDDDDSERKPFVCSISGSPTSATTAGCADGAATEILTSFQVSGTMVSGLSGASGRCLDYVKFHYADGGSTMVGPGSGGTSFASQDIDPAVEYVSGLVQYEGCGGTWAEYMFGGIEFIVKSIATGATTRTVSFAGSDQSASVRAEFSVEWPCRIIGFETSPGDADKVTGETVSGVLTDCAGVESTVVACGGPRDDDDDDSDDNSLVVILCVIGAFFGAAVFVGATVNKCAAKSAKVAATTGATAVPNAATDDGDTITVEAPPGRLGLKFDGTSTRVKEVFSDSSLVGKVYPGDALKSINGMLTAGELIHLAAAASDGTKQRTLVFVRKNDLQTGATAADAADGAGATAAARTAQLESDLAAARDALKERDRQLEKARIDADELRKEVAQAQAERDEARLEAQLRDTPRQATEASVVPGGTAPAQLATVLSVRHL